MGSGQGLDEHPARPGPRPQPAGQPRQHRIGADRKPQRQQQVDGVEVIAALAHRRQEPDPGGDHGRGRDQQQPACLRLPPRQHADPQCHERKRSQGELLAQHREKLRGDGVQPRALAPEELPRIIQRQGQIPEPAAHVVRRDQAGRHDLRQPQDLARPLREASEVAGAQRDIGVQRQWRQQARQRRQPAPRPQEQSRIHQQQVDEHRRPEQPQADVVGQPEPQRQRHGPQRGLAVPPAQQQPDAEEDEESGERMHLGRGRVHPHARGRGQQHRGRDGGRPAGAQLARG